MLYFGCLRKKSVLDCMPMCCLRTEGTKREPSKLSVEVYVLDLVIPRLSLRRLPRVAAAQWRSDVRDPAKQRIHRQSFFSNVDSVDSVSSIRFRVERASLLVGPGAL